MKFRNLLTTFSLVAAAASMIACADGLSADNHHDTPTTPAEAKKAPDIVDTAVAAKDFNTLVAAVKAADLVDVLKSEGPFTVFAPTDAAFAKLPDGTVESLLKPENKKKLQAILTYHVVPGKLMSGDVVKKSELKTVQGQSLNVEVKDGKVMIDGATITTVDVEASNGVIHIIDSVVLPK